MSGLDRAGIDTRPFFHPLSSLPAYRGLGGAEKWRQKNPVSYALAPWGVNLPSGLNLTEELVARVSRSVKELIAAGAAQPAS